MDPDYLTNMGADLMAGRLPAPAQLAGHDWLTVRDLDPAALPWATAQAASVTALPGQPWALLFIGDHDATTPVNLCVLVVADGQLVAILATEPGPVGILARRADTDHRRLTNLADMAQAAVEVMCESVGLC